MISDIKIRIRFGRVNSLNAYLELNLPPPHTTKMGYYHRKYLVIFCFSSKYRKLKCMLSYLLKWALSNIHIFCLNHSV